MFKFVLVALALAAATSAVPLDLDRGGRIVGGTAVQIYSRPFQAAFLTINDNQFCGGSIISNRWVLSAAHCFKMLSASAIKVLVGTSRLDASYLGSTYSIDQIIMHEAYVSVTDGKDIALAKTSITITFKATVAPISLPTKSTESVIQAVVSGWGKTSNPGSPSNQLQALSVFTLTNAECKSYNLIVTDDVICAFSQAGKGTCFGDSGGPLTANNEVIGIISWTQPCALGFPDGYTRVYEYRSWILSKIS